MFIDLKNEVKARAILNESSTEFDTMIGNAINSSLFRISRDFNIRSLRRKTTFDTVSEYSEGTGAVTVTNGSASVSVVGATLITDGVHIGRRVDLGGSARQYIIKTITGETTFTVDQLYDGTTSSTQSYNIHGQEEYNLNIQTGKIAIMWHEDYNYPYVMQYVPDLQFYNANMSQDDDNVPTMYRQWGSNSVVEQPRQDGVITISSSSSSDTNMAITVFGTVGGYPDYEVITTDSSDGTVEVSGSKSFNAGSIERVTKAGSTTGRITLTADSGETTVSVLTVGDYSDMNEFMKVQIFPFPTRVFPIHVGYYKDPYKMVNDNDIHELGYDFDEAITCLAVSKINYSQDKTNAKEWFALYKDEMKSLRSKNSDAITSWFPRLKRVSHASMGHSPHRYLGFNQLSGFYGPVM